MAVEVQRPDAQAPTLGQNVGYLHNAGWGQLGCLTLLITFFILFIVGMVSGDSGGDDNSGLTGFILIAVAIVLLVAKSIDRDKVATHGPTSLIVNADWEDEQRVSRLSDDVGRFTTMVERAGLTAVSGRALTHVRWVLWYAAVRTNRIGEIQRSVKSAGSHATGPAKAAWLKAREEEITALRRPVREAMSQVAKLANLAEDVTFAAQLAREKGVSAGELYGTFGLDLPQPMDVNAADAIEEATDRLIAWHRTWAELDEKLRIAAASIHRDER